MTGEASRDVQQDLDTSDISGTGMAAWDGSGVHDPVDNTNIILNDVEMTVKSNQEGRKSGGETGKSSHETGKTSLEDTLKNEAKALMGNVECDNEGEGGAARVPDGGWGWLVVFGSFIITLLVPLLGPCFGVLFSSYLLEAGSSSATTAWIFNVQCFIWNMMGLIVRPLVKEFGWRNIAFQGILLTSASVIISAFAPSPVFLFFSFSLLSGLGGGLAVCMSFILVPMYFDRRRGLANAIMMAGVCTGQIVGPPFVRLLQEQYTYKGATLILGAIMLNGLVGAAFYHPVEWHMKPARNDPLLPKVNVNSLNDGVAADETSKKYFLIANGEKEPGWSESLCRVRTLREDGTYQSSECLKASHTESVTLSLSSLCKPALSAPVSQSAKERVRRNRSEQVGFATLILSVARNTINNLKIFRSPRAVIISFGCTFFLNGYYNFLMMVPFAMQASGRTLQDSAWCISVSGVCHLVARTLISVLSDWSRFNMRLAYMAGLASTAFTILVFPLLLEFELRWLMVTMAVWGCGIGTTMGLYTLVMIKFMGLENLGAVYGASSLTVGFGFLSIGPLIGLVRDSSDSYAVSMWVLSGVVLTSFILWLFMPAAQDYDQRRVTKQSQKEDPEHC
ncbi:monocarboxylate transporter 9-like [Cherax quadricarinatus]|uniref:monocarboxylate transporter 9-like n=1 Tax=Cherax quadricarinatus TaxID=27406 RepID=UPI00387E4EF6